jgi:hypothetical protein
MNTTKHIIHFITLSTIFWSAPPILYAGDEGAKVLSAAQAPGLTESNNDLNRAAPKQLADEQLDAVVAGQPLTLPELPITPLTLPALPALPELPQTTQPTDNAASTTEPQGAGTVPTASTNVPSGPPL